MRCVKDEHTAVNMNLHYLENGTVMLNFIYQKELFFLPLGFALKVVIRVNNSKKCLMVSRCLPMLFPLSQTFLNAL